MGARARGQSRDGFGQPSIAWPSCFLSGTTLDLIQIQQPASHNSAKMVFAWKAAGIT